jgi:hypothetical protein
MTTPQTLIKHLATSLPSSSSSSGKPIRALKAYIQSYIDLVLAPPSDRALLRVIKSTDTNIKLITDISGIESRNIDPEGGAAEATIAYFHACRFSGGDEAVEAWEGQEEGG